MATIKVPTTFNIDVEFEIPEFYRRLLSLLIDMAIEICYLILAGKLFSLLTVHMDPYDEDTRHNLWGLSWLVFLPVALYHIIMEITMNGQSFGKRLMGIRVVHENGGRASVSQFLIRWMLRLSDQWIIIIVIILLANPNMGLEGTVIVLFGLAFLITDIILAVSSKKGQRIGDFLAHTILIRTSSRASIEETVFQEVEDSYKPSFPQIMQLSDRDINSIKSILEAARKKGDYNIAEAASDKIKAHLKIESPLSAFGFLELLLKDYNYLSTK
ncbi:MAG: RDD family protein [Chitinophagaceae bacterium]